MPIDPIKIELSGYNKIQILRKQLDERIKEFGEIESTINEILIYLNEIEYLKSFSPAYESLDGKEQLDQITTLEARRSELHDLIQLIEEMIPQVEKEIKGGGGAAPSPAPSRSIQRNAVAGSSPAAAPAQTPPAANAPEGKKPLSFDDFRKNFPSSGV
ncbi:MAG: hypothetical protein COA79_01585 [Planctomycetota bacterium]|nr:MAG: hypothetical protein COA79_01585 [Planctomycetota bacterium]